MKIVISTICHRKESVVFFRISKSDQSSEVIFISLLFLVLIVQTSIKNSVNLKLPENHLSVILNCKSSNNYRCLTLELFENMRSSKKLSLVINLLALIDQMPIK